MRRAVGILLVTGLVFILGWSGPAMAGSFQPSSTVAGKAAVRADFNGDGQADLAIGAPGENGSRGVVHVLYGAAGGLTAAGSQLWSQDSPGIAGTAEASDFFGAALASEPLSTTTGAGTSTSSPAATSPAERNRFGQ
jgi:hypothetical protein